MTLPIHQHIVKNTLFTWDKIIVYYIFTTILWTTDYMHIIFLRIYIYICILIAIICFYILHSLGTEYLPIFWRPFLWKIITYSTTDSVVIATACITSIMSIFEFTHAIKRRYPRSIAQYTLYTRDAQSTLCG